MRFVNLTPHTLNIHCGDEILNLEPSGDVARVEIKEVPSAPIQGVPTVAASYGEVIGLPEPDIGVRYVVSGVVEAQVSRSDVLAPGSPVRDKAGKVIGCKGLRRTAGGRDAGS